MQIIVVLLPYFNIGVPLYTGHWGNVSSAARCIT